MTPLIPKLSSFDYSKFFANPTFPSSRNDAVYPYFYPLTSQDPKLGDRLNFFIHNPNPDWNISYGQVGNVTSDSVFPRFTSPPENPTSQLRMSAVPSGTDPTPDNFFYMDTDEPSRTTRWAISKRTDGPTNGGIWYKMVPGANQGTAGQNLRVQMQGSDAYDRLLCYDPTNTADPFEFKLSFQPTTSMNDAACKWRTNEEVFGCCTATPAEASNPDIQQRCGPAFMPNGTGGSLCVPFMLNICENNWNQDYCSLYLQSFQNGVGNSDVATVFQTATVNYINGIAQKVGCGTNDYTSPSIGPSCRIPSGPNAGQLRDDSKDTFINGTMFDFCKTNPEACENILNQYCSEFTRHDLNQDASLQRLCGCHLSDGFALAPGTSPLNLTNQSRPPNQYVYPQVTTSCDPLCAFSDTLPSTAPQCASTVCIMDNVGINLINSQCGDVNISQVCGPSYNGGGATGTCYMSSVDIDSINSSCGGAAIAQNCHACYVFTPGDASAAVPVDCKNPSGVPGGGNGGGGGISSSASSGLLGWIKSHPFAVTGIAISLIFILFIILMLTTNKPESV